MTTTINIASILTRKSLGSAKEYTPGVYAAFDGEEMVATFPTVTLTEALETIEHVNTNCNGQVGFIA